MRKTKKQKEPREKTRHPEANYEHKKNWLEETARGKRDTVKPDCQILMNYLDEIGLQYEHRPAIMLKDIDRCKGYIPDLVFHHPAADVIVDFVKPSKYFSWDYYKTKAADLEGDGYLYYVIRAGEFKNILPEVFFEEIEKDIPRG